MPKQKIPWKQSVLYQVYPWSFNEDEVRNPQLGNGSIRGMIEKLPYLIDLGVNAIWVSPPYPGPMKDAGYDTTDITGIHSGLGTLADFDEFLALCHEHGIRVMLDYVPNHTSEQHEWFQKSRHREPGFEDWYIWHPGELDKYGRRNPPNNWASVFSKPNRKARDHGEMPELSRDDWTPYISAWQWDDVRGEFYLHLFEKEQPDLNWSNPKVVEAMLNNMRLWMDRGVDGFRMDAVNHMAKNYMFHDEMINPDYNEEDFDNPFDQLLLHNSSNYMPMYHEILDKMCGMVREEKYHGRGIQLIIESYMGEDELRKINSFDSDVATTFNFGAFGMPWNAFDREAQMDYYYRNLNKRNLPNQLNGNHDNPRLATRLGDDAARAAAVMNLFLPGMRVIYNGEELGLHDGIIPESRIQDPNGLRDPARTPIIWDDAKPNGGFSRAMSEDLWLPINETDLELSVTRQQNDPTSSLSLYKTAIRFCREIPAFVDGEYSALRTNNESVMTYGRSHGDEKAIVLVNFTDDPQHVFDIRHESHDGTTFEKIDVTKGRPILSSLSVTTGLNELDLSEGVRLRPNEALVIALT